MALWELTQRLTGKQMYLVWADTKEQAIRIVQDNRGSARYTLDFEVTSTGPIRGKKVDKEPQDD